MTSSEFLGYDTYGIPVGFVDGAVTDQFHPCPEHEYAYWHPELQAEPVDCTCHSKSMVFDVAIVLFFLGAIVGVCVIAVIAAAVNG